MRRPGLPRERVLAGMVRILEACFMRPGSEAYARENHSYGLTTVRPRHTKVAGDLVVYDFRGKSGQRQIREIRDARVARLVRGCLRVPGRDVFKFQEDGEVIDVRRRHVNAYLREISGAPFTAKDFRTWAGTLLCASELARRHAEPAVARAGLACALGDGEVLGAKPELCEAERALVALLRAAERRPALRVIVGGGGGRGERTGEGARPAGATGKPVRRAARRPER